MERSDYFLTSYHKKRKYVYRSLVTLFHKEMQINYCIVLYCIVLERSDYLRSKFYFPKDADA